MDRELRILNHNKQDATKIVSRKPSPSDGSNGDLVLGNTVQGAMLYAKTNNRWYEFKPREAPKKERQTAQKGAYFLTEVHAHDRDSHWMMLGKGPTRHGASIYYVGWAFDLRFVSYWQGGAGGTIGHWRSHGKIPYFLTNDVKIKGIYAKQHFIENGEEPDYIDGIIDPYLPLLSTLFIYELPEETERWDAENNYVQSALHPVDSATYDISNSETFITNAEGIIESQDTMFNYKIDNSEHVYKKGSHIAIRAAQSYPKGYTAQGYTGQEWLEFTGDGLDERAVFGNWMIHLEIQEESTEASERT